MTAWFEREWQRLGGGALVFLPLTLVFWLVSSLRRAMSSRISSFLACRIRR